MMMIAWFRITKMLYMFYGCFLQLRKLLQVSYYNCCYCIVFTGLLRD